MSANAGAPNASAYPPPQTDAPAAVPQQSGPSVPPSAPPVAFAAGAPAVPTPQPAMGTPAPAPPAYVIKPCNQPVLSFTGSAPFPPPAVSMKTPDEMWQQRVNDRNMSRAMEEERHRQRQAVPKKGFLASVEKALLNVGHQVDTVCSDFSTGAERSLRESDKNAVYARYQRVFPTLAGENRLLAGFECTLYNGFGEAATGMVFLTERLLAFAPDAMHACRPPVFDELKNVVSYQVVQTFGAPAIIIFTGSGFAYHFALFHKNIRQDLQSLWGSATGPPFSNFLTYFDHQWRIVAPVPAPGYHYSPNPYYQGPAQQFKSS